MKYVATILFNLNHDHWFGYQDSHEADLVAVPIYPSVEGDGTSDAAEHVFAVANKVYADTDGTPWPAHVRSLSVGDVVILGDENSVVTVMAVESTGWKYLPDFNLSGAFQRPAAESWRLLTESGNVAVEPW